MRESNEWNKGYAVGFLTGFSLSFIVIFTLGQVFG